MSVNVERLEAVMAHITAHPEQHDQSRWCTRWLDGEREECGTTACFAGWTAELFAEGEGYSQFNSAVSWRRGQKLIHVQDLATELLGLDGKTRDKLFEANNSRRMLELMVKDLANGEELRDLSEYEDQEREGWVAMVTGPQVTEDLD